MRKSCVNAAETINKYFLSLADNLAVSISSSLESPADRDFLSFMEQTIKFKYPKICINPVSTGEIEKIFILLKINTLVAMMKYQVLKLSTPYISSPFNYI
jgi:oligoribonuclease (3'-5' exoribonuclease)